MSEAAVEPGSTLRSRVVSEAPFLVAVALAVLVRVVVVVAFPPGFVHSDGPAYLTLVDDFRPTGSHPAGYGVLLWLVALADRGVAAVTLVQHVLGIVAAAVVYALLRRWSVRPWAATLAALPLLFDQMQLVLEHSVLSDVLFVLVLVLAVAVLAWTRPLRLPAVAAAGLLLGALTLVRLVGEPSVVAGALFCLLVAGPWRVRLARVVALAVCFAIPVTAYAAWYHDVNGAWGLTTATNRSLYMRTTSFVDCAHLDVPTYELALCPREPVGERLDPTAYGWRPQETLPPLVLPPGVTREQALGDFAESAIRQQPLGYARTVLRDLALDFFPQRTDHYGYQTSRKWQFGTYIGTWGTPRYAEAYAAHGGVQPTARQPWADLLARYDTIVYLPGPLLLALLALAVAGLFVRRRAAEPDSRPLIVLLLSLGLGITLVPDMTLEFVWRYQLPSIVLIPVAAALGWTRLRAARRASRCAGEDGQPGTTPTPSTDCPKGGVIRRSIARVQGTTNRS